MQGSSGALCVLCGHPDTHSDCGSHCHLPLHSVDKCDP